MNVDDMTGVERPRTRRILSIVSVLIPIVVLAGGAAWYVRTYILPPSIQIGDPAAFAFTEPQQAAADTQAVAPPLPQQETTGNAAPPAEPAVRYTNDTAAIWAAVPLPSAPRVSSSEVQSLAPVDPQIAVDEPIAGPIPLPPRRPRISSAAPNGPVPLPRARPSAD